MNSFERFTNNAKKTLIAAQKTASINNEQITPRHILTGLLSVKEGLAYDVMSGFGLTQEKIFSIMETSPSTYSRGVGLSVEAKRSIEKSLEYAKRFNQMYVGTEHILLGVLSDGDDTIMLLEQLGISANDIISQVETLLSNGFSQGNFPQGDFFGIKEDRAEKRHNKKTPYLDKFGSDLTKEAKAGKLDPIIGRNIEIARTIAILNRRIKNNPILIGEPGVGKTAIVEGLAQKIINDEVPEMLLGKRVVTLDLAGMVAGTKYRGEFEDRLKKVIDEVKKDGNIILFVDEFHTIVGAGAAEGAIDAANILKPSLAKGGLKIIGATTLGEYQKYIEKDPALERRFQSILVRELTVEETIQVLFGIRKLYEEHHKLTITDEAIDAAVKLSSRYISDRFLPDKAIDLIDEASSNIRVKNGNLPKNMKDKQKQLKEILNEKEDAVFNQEYEKAAKLKIKEMRIKEEIDNAETERGNASIRDLKITKEDIANVISSMTGVPINKLIKKETESLINLDKKIKERIIGQDEAVEELARYIKRSRTGISDEKRPNGSFIFLGPTGVGKTETAKVLAKEVFDNEDALIKVDMSEFMEKHNVSRLVGAPAGYVGYEEGGKLTEKVRHNPYSLILLDEIEKAHPDVFNMLLQILEDGYLTDAKGRKVDFRNTIIIMTSNIGMEKLTKQAMIGFEARSSEDKERSKEQYDIMKTDVLKELKEKFKPEFLNRVDKVIVFRPLDKKAIEKIVKIELNVLGERITNQEITLSFTKKVEEFIAREGNDPENGARPIRRAIQNIIEDALAEGMLLGKYKEGDSLKIDVIKDKIKITKSK